MGPTRAGLLLGVVTPSSLVEHVVPAARARVGARTIERGGFAEAAARKLWPERERIDPESHWAYVERFHDSAVVGAAWAGLVSELLGA